MALLFHLTSHLSSFNEVVPPDGEVKRYELWGVVCKLTYWYINSISHRFKIHSDFYQWLCSSEATKDGVHAIHNLKKKATDKFIMVKLSF